MRDPGLLIVSGAAYEVRYLLHNGRYRAKEFFDKEAPGNDRARFLALARRLASMGQLQNGQQGHRLHHPYHQLFEFKPPTTRFFAFFEERTVWVASAAKKKKPKEQVADYEAAEKMRKAFLNSL